MVCASAANRLKDDGGALSTGTEHRAPSTRELFAMQPQRRTHAAGLLTSANCRHCAWQATASVRLRR